MGFLPDLQKDSFLRMYQSVRNDITAIFLLFLASLSICLQSPFAPGGNFKVNCDSAIFSYIGWAMKEGYVPYTELKDSKGPLLYFINFLGQLIDGYTGIFILECVFMWLAMVFCFYSMKRLFRDPAVSILGTLYAFFLLPTLFWNGNMSEEYVLPFSFLALYYFISHLIDPKGTRPVHIIVTGICFGASVMLKANQFSTYAGFACVISLNMVRLKQFRLWTLLVLYFLLGTVVSFAPFVLYLTVKGALSECLTYAYIEPSWIFGSISTLEKMKQLDALLDFLTPSHGDFVLGAYLLASVVYLVVSRTGNKVYRDVISSINIGIILNLYLSSKSNLPFSHYFISYLPMIAFPSTVGLFLISKLMTSSSYKAVRDRKAVIAALSLLVAIISFNNLKTCTLNIYHNFSGNYTLAFRDGIASKSAPSDKIYIFDGYMHYYMTDRVIGSRYIYLYTYLKSYPQKHKIQELDQLLRDLQKTKPKIILYTDQSWKYYSTLNYYDWEPFNKFIKDNYYEDARLMEFHVWTRKPSIK